MKYGFTGTRDGVTVAQILTLGEFLLGCTQFDHGDCVGSDAQAHRLCREFLGDFGRNIWIVVHPPENPGKRAWCKGDVILEPKPYFVRNHDIVDATDELLATPNSFVEPLQKRGQGTWSTINYAKRVGKKVSIIYPDGSTWKE